MDVIHRLAVRSDDDDDDASDVTNEMFTLVIVLLCLVSIALLLIAGLYFLRNKRIQRESQLPMYNSQVTATTPNHRRLTITAGPCDGQQSIYVYSEKKELLGGSMVPPPSPVPEIRITFPEEEGEDGKHKAGRVVVVRVGESGTVGMEPCKEDDLPPYQNGETGRFQSLDLERMGGLKERDDVAAHS